jgi:hypothetical protein
MNNMSSYCGLVDAKVRASDKDLPVCTFSRYEVGRWQKFSPQESKIVQKLFAIGFSVY